MTQKALLEKLKRAAEDYSEFHFCESYYTKYRPDICTVAHSEQNIDKNRANYWGFPYDNNLISSVPGYINASPMRLGEHYYIAAQGPRENTFEDFWQMVLSENVTEILSLTNETEHVMGMTQMKFHRFWPDKDVSHYGEIQVQLSEDKVIKEWCDGRQERIRRRQFIVSHQDKSKIVTHFHMENWPDRGIVQPDSLFALAEQVDNVKQNGAIVVHCAAGVGRTGTFIAFHSLYHDLLKQIQNPEESHFDITKRIRKMRELRWGAMVAEVEQYQLLIDTLQLAVHSKL